MSQVDESFDVENGDRNELSDEYKAEILEEKDDEDVSVDGELVAEHRAFLHAADDEVRDVEMGFISEETHSFGVTGVVEIQHDEDLEPFNVESEYPEDIDEDNSDSMHHFRNDDDIDRLHDMELVTAATHIEENTASGDTADNFHSLLSLSNSTIDEMKALNESYFLRFGGVMEEMIVMHILVYGSAVDLCRLASVSRYFYRVTQKQALWVQLYSKDFYLDEATFFTSAAETASVASTIQTAPVPSLFVAPPSSTASQNNGTQQNQRSSGNSNGKVTYVQRFRELNQRMLRAKEERRLNEQNLRRDDHVHSLEQVLDVFQVRLVCPIAIAAIFLTIVLLCQRIDEQLTISYFECFIPIWISIIYTVLCFIMLDCLVAHQYDSASLLNGMWNKLRGPYKFLYQEILGESTLLVYGFYFILFLVLAETVLIGLKLSTENTDENIYDALDWGFVFIPIWLIMTLFCFIPIFNRRLEFFAFVISIAILWIPFAIFFICLAVKLNGQDTNNKDGNIPLYLIFIPFWIIQAFILLSSLGFLIIGLSCGMRGMQLYEHISIFIICWLSNAPLITFQALLSVRDHALISGGISMIPTATETATPILIVLGIAWIASLLISIGYKTQFQINRERALQNNAGMRIIYQF